MNQAYQDACIIIPTKHAKSIAIAPPFWERLSASVLEYYVDSRLAFRLELKRRVGVAQ